MIANWTSGETLFLRGAHPVDAKSEVVVLITPEVAAGAVEAKPAAPPAKEISEAALRIRTKAEQIIIPKIDLRDATLAEALLFLRVKAKELDPEKEGINFVVEDSPPGDPRITMTLRDVPLKEALHYVTELAGMKFRFDGNAVTIVSVKVADPKTLVTRTFRTPKDFITDKGGATKWLERQGISFPDGTTATWVPATSHLTVRNTAGELDKVEALVKRAVDAEAVVEESPLLKRADAIIFPRIQFTEATIKEAVEFLNVKAKELDPQKQGVNILLHVPADVLVPKITMDLTNIPLREALRYVARLGGLNLETEPYAFILEAK